MDTPRRFAVRDAAARLSFQKVFSAKEGSQGSQTPEVLRDKGSSCEPYQKQGSQQGSQAVHANG